MEQLCKEAEQTAGSIQQGLQGKLLSGKFHRIVASIKDMNGKLSRELLDYRNKETMTLYNH